MWANIGQQILAKTKQRKDRMKIRKENGRDGVIYRIDAGRINGKRVRFASTSKKKADAKLASLKAKKKAVGDQWATITESDKVRLSQIHEEIQTAGFSLAYIWDEFRRLRGRDTGKTNVTVDDGIRALVKAKTLADRNARHVHQVATECGHFSKTVNGNVRDIASITVPQIEAYCHGPNRRTGKPVSRQTIINRSLRLSALFSYAWRMGWCDANPVSRMEKIRPVNEVPYIIPNDHARRLMAGAVADFPDALPQIVLCLFAGLRAGEASQMRWSDINLDKGILTVRPEISKMRDTRIVKPHATALAWLEYCHALREDDRDDVHRFTPPNITHKIQKLRKAIKLADDEWAHAAMRHTAATHLYHITESLDGLARNMGHSMGVFLKHYRGLIDAEKSEAFWGITPDSIKGVGKSGELAA
jgi:integrase